MKGTCSEVVDELWCNVNSSILKTKSSSVSSSFVLVSIFCFLVGECSLLWRSHSTRLIAIWSIIYHHFLLYHHVQARANLPVSYKRCHANSCVTGGGRCSHFRLQHDGVVSSDLVYQKRGGNWFDKVLLFWRCQMSVWARVIHTTCKYIPLSN